MDETDRNILRRNHVYLVQNLLVDETFLNHLYQEAIISQHDYEELRVEPTNYKRASHFLTSILPQRGPRAFDGFTKACNDTGQEFVADTLKAVRVQREAEHPESRGVKRNSPTVVASSTSLDMKFAYETFLTTSAEPIIRKIKTEPQAQLSDALIWKLSRTINNGTKLTDLGIFVLKLPDYEIEGAKVNQHTVQEAARHVLLKWRAAQNNHQEAFDKLHTGLLNSEDFRILAAELQQWTEEGQESTDLSQKLTLEKIQLEMAFQDALAKGSKKKSYRGRLNIIGYYRAGKTSLLVRLLGKTFNPRERSTEGITTQVVRIKAGAWNEALLNVKKLEEDFNKEVLSRISEEKKDEIETNDPDTVDAETQNATPKKMQVTSFMEMSTGKVVVVEANSIKLDDETYKQLLEQNLKGAEHQMEDDYFISVWDFGGQTAYYATHHLFLNSEATHVIAMDITLDLYTPLAHEDKEEISIAVPSTPAEFLTYWLNTIHSIASDEHDSHPKVAIVLTHKDRIDSDNTQQYVEDYKCKILKHVEGKEFARYISGDNIYVADNKLGKNSDFDEIRQKIFQSITEQKNWGKERPVRWLKLEAEIRKKGSENSVGYLNVKIVKELALKYGIDNEELETFLEFHHKMGDFVHFPDDALRDLIITDAQWLVDSFKAFITPHEFIESRKIAEEIKEELKKGFVSERSLELLWEGDDVTFLRELMMKFNLMLQLQSENGQRRFLIPCMLPPQSRDIYNREPFTKMELAYNAFHKPKSGEAFQIGIFHRLLSECSKVPNWRICIEDHLSYTDASFEIENDVRLALSQVTTRSTKNTVLRASVWCTEDAKKDGLKSTILATRRAFDSCTKSLNVLIGDTFLMCCPECLSGNVSHCLVNTHEHCEANVSTFDANCNIHGNITMHWGSRPKQKISASANLSTQDDLDCAQHTGPREGRRKSLAHAALEILKDQIQVAEILTGKECVIKAADSDVSLHVPKGVHGLLLGRARTDLSRFLHLIPINECISSPICEYTVLPFSDKQPVPENAQFMIQIPHVVKDTKNIIVRHGNIHNGNFKRCTTMSPTERGNIRYKIGPEYVEFFTNHFSATLVTEEGLRCCCRSANVITFGALSALTESNPLVKLKVFLASLLYNIEDSRSKVRIWMSQIGLKMLDISEVQLSAHPYDAEKSSVNIAISRDDSKKWDIFQNLHAQDMNLYAALKFDKEHICRSPPTEVARFYLDATEKLIRTFQGTLHIDVNIARRPEAEPGHPSGATQSVLMRGDGPGAVAAENKRYTVRIQIDDSRKSSTRTVGELASTATGENYPVQTDFEQLMDMLVVHTSKQITDGNELVDLGVSCLELKLKAVEAVAYDKQYSIQGATRKVLSMWREKQNGHKDACVKLCPSLEAYESFKTLAYELRQMLPADIVCEDAQ